MNEETINKIRELVKEKQMVRVGDVYKVLKLNPTTALSYLLEMEIKGILTRTEFKTKNKNYTYKIWRIKE